MEGIDERFARVYSHHHAATRRASLLINNERRGLMMISRVGRIESALMKWRDDHCSCSRPLDGNTRDPRDVLCVWPTRWS